MNDSAPHSVYAAPEARLKDDDLDEGASTDVDAPSTFVATLTAVSVLTRQIYVPLLGLAVAWGVFFGINNYFLNTAYVDFFFGERPKLLAVVPVVAFYLVGPFIWIRAIQRVDAHGRQHPRVGGFDRTAEKFVPVLGFLLLSIPMTWLGLVVLVVPGVVIGTILAVGEVAIVTEDRGPIEAMKRCLGLFDSIGDWLYVFGLLVAAGLVTGVVVGLVNAWVTSLIGTGEYDFSTAALGGAAVANGVTAVAVFPLWVAVHVLAFHGLVARSRTQTPKAGSNHEE